MAAEPKTHKFVAVRGEDYEDVMRRVSSILDALMASYSVVACPTTQLQNGSFICTIIHIAK